MSHTLCFWHLHCCGAIPTSFYIGKIEMKANRPLLWDWKAIPEGVATLMAKPKGVCDRSHQRSLLMTSLCSSNLSSKSMNNHIDHDDRYTAFADHGIQKDNSFFFCVFW